MTELVRFKESDWEEARKAVTQLVSDGRGKGAIAYMLGANSILEDAETDCNALDSDDVVNFEHESHKGRLETLNNEYGVVYDLTCDAGQLMEDYVDKPFKDDIVKFTEGVSNINIDDYVCYPPSGPTDPYSGAPIPVDINDIFNFAEFYSDFVGGLYDEWIEQNPDLRAWQDSMSDFYKWLEEERFGFECTTSQEKFVDACVEIGKSIAGAFIPVYSPVANKALGNAVKVAAGANFIVDVNESLEEGNDLREALKDATLSLGLGTAIGEGSLKITDILGDLALNGIDLSGLLTTDGYLTEKPVSDIDPTGTNKDGVDKIVEGVLKGTNVNDEVTEKIIVNADGVELDSISR